MLSKRVLPTVIHVDVLKLLQLWDYEHTLGDKVSRGHGAQGQGLCGCNCLVHGCGLGGLIAR